MYTTPLPTNVKDFSTLIRINRIPGTEREYTGSLVSVANKAGKQDGISQRDGKNTEHTAAGTEIPGTEREYTGSLVSVANKAGKPDGISQRDGKNTEHTAAEEILYSDTNL